MNGILLFCILMMFLFHVHQNEVSSYKETNISSANDEQMKTTTESVEDLFQYADEDANGMKYLKEEEYILDQRKEPENQDRDKNWREREPLEYKQDKGHTPHPRKRAKAFHASTILKSTTTEIPPENRKKRRRKDQTELQENTSDEENMAHERKQRKIIHDIHDGSNLNTRTMEPTPKDISEKRRQKDEVGLLEARAQQFSRDTDKDQPNQSSFSTRTIISMSELNKELEDHPKIKDDASLHASYTRENDQESVTNKLRSSRQRRSLQAVLRAGETMVCQGEFSCRNRCQHPLKLLHELRYACYCDEECEFFQDCCADYDVFCSASAAQNMTNSTTQNTTTVEYLVTQENKNLWKCYEGEKLPGINGVWMIGSCPRSWPEDDVLYKCRNLSTANMITRDNYQYLPVYTSNGRVYHNRFCAQCNGVSTKDFKEFSLNFDCHFTPPKRLSLNATISFYFTFCKESAPRKASYWSPEKGDPRRYCLPLDQDNRCHAPYNASLILTKCLTGKPRVVTAHSFYKNIACALCKNYQIDEISCGPNITASNYNVELPGQIIVPPKPLSVIFNFNNDYPKGLWVMQIKTRCPSATVFDHYLGVCKSTIPALPRLSEFYEYQVVLWTEPLPDEQYDASVYRQSIAQALTVSEPNVAIIEIDNNISFNLKILKSENKKVIVQNLLDFTTPFKLVVSRKVYTVVKATARIVSCVNRQKYFRSEYAVLDDSSAVYIKNTGEIFQSTEYYINTTETRTLANDSQAIFLCRLPQISNCLGVYILINEGEFRVLMNKSIFVNASKQVYDWSEYTWVNKSVLVCENFSTTYNKSKKVPTDDPVLTTITIVCMSLSIIGLVFVLVTYSLFSELRTPPGINLMNLSVSILLAQLLWLLGSGQTDTPMACTAIAIILHYLFLASFLWTSIIAFDTWRAFSSKNRSSSDSKRDKCIKVIRHMAIGWLPGLAYVSICVALDFTETVDIGYKSRIACWMANKWAILYFFAVPVFMLLVFNTVFCVLTFRAIKTTAEQTREALDQDTKKTFGIYVRIASLMGFTWIFGFAAPFGWQFLWYPFVILNGLQGVYIALAFALNRRARGLYKGLVQSCKPQPRPATSLPTLARTDTQETMCNNESLDISL